MLPPERRCWSVSLDGEALCVGIATLPCGGGAPAICTQSWGAGSFLTLRFPPAVHENPGLLCSIFALLDVRQRLRCAAVCRAWRAALEAPPAQDTASVWRCVDLSAAAFPRPAIAVNALLMAKKLLPRREAYVEELCLRGCDVSVAGAMQSLARFPRLRLLDLRDCQRMHQRFYLPGVVFFLCWRFTWRKRKRGWILKQQLLSYFWMEACWITVRFRTRCVVLPCAPTSWKPPACYTSCNSAPCTVIVQCLPTAARYGCALTLLSARTLPQMRAALSCSCRSNLRRVCRLRLTNASRDSRVQTAALSSAWCVFFLRLADVRQLTSLCAAGLQARAHLRAPATALLEVPSRW